MQELEEWIDLAVINPLYEGWSHPEYEQKTVDLVINDVKDAIKQKVLESYRNGKGEKAGQGRGKFTFSGAKNR